MEKILIIEDDALMQWSIAQKLTREGYEVSRAETGTKGITEFKNFCTDLVLLDLMLPEMNGLEVLAKIKEINPEALVIMITAYADVETVVKAIKGGAYDYIKKPFNLDELVFLVKRTLDNNIMMRELNKVRSNLKSRYGFDNIIGKTEALQRICRLIEKIAMSEASTVLIQGESGTGKELVAKAIHYQSLRAEKPFIEVNVTSLSPSLIESELFGHEKGAFTDAKFTKKGLFELAHGGSLFLDELGDLDPGLQAKLLRFLENKTFRRVGGSKDLMVDERIIAATNKDLETEVKNGRFREDLYYRLKVIPIHMPTLRERGGDIILLANYFMQRFNKEFRKGFRYISPEAARLLLDYPWPGNVRELKNVIERILILESGDSILPDHLPPEIIAYPAKDHKDNGELQLDLGLPAEEVSLNSMERFLVEKALKAAKGNQTHAARLLKISRDMLRYRLKKYNLKDYS